MNFPGVWVTESGTLIYRVIPKCACSTIGQVLYHSDHGAFFDGDIHDAKEGIWKWNGNRDRERAREVIARAVRDGKALTFTCVRNPYTRVLSCFLDKICGIQRSGNRYRSDMVPMICRHYQMEIGRAPDEPFDQIRAFRKFLLFVRDTVKFRHPMHPDIHWSPISSHAATLVKNGGCYDRVFSTEGFNEGMRAVLAAAEPAHRTDLNALPRFNESEGHGPPRAHAIEDYFDDLAQHIMCDVYGKDFEVFGYSREPGRGAPEGPLDAADINARLSR